MQVKLWGGRVAAAAAAAAVVCASSAFAGTAPSLPDGGITLDQILDPAGPYQGSFVIKDKLFDIKAFAGTSIMAGDLTFVPVNFGLAGIGFDILGEFIDVPGDGAASGFALEYNVTVLNPNKLISDVELAFNGFAFGENCFTDVNESIFDPNSTDLLDTLNVFASGNVPQDDWVLQDEVVFGDPAGYSTLNIVKDFEIFACDEAGVGVSFIRQTFSQIPGPGAAMLPAVAAIGLLRRRR